MSPAEPPFKKVKFKRVALEQKIWFLDLRVEHPSWTSARLAEAFKEKFGGDLLKRSTVSDWLKPDAIRKVREQFENADATGKNKAEPTRVRGVKCAKLEDALAIWLYDKEAQDGMVTDEVLVEKARRLAQEFPELEVPETFAFSCGWMWNFKKRKGVRSITKHGEAGSADMLPVQHAANSV